MQRYSIRDIKNAILAHNGRNIEARRFFNMLVGGVRAIQVHGKGKRSRLGLGKKGHFASKVPKLFIKPDYGKKEYIYYQKLLQNIHIPDFNIQNLFEYYTQQLKKTNKTFTENFDDEIVNIILKFKFKKKSKHKKSKLKKELLQFLQDKLKKKIDDKSTKKAEKKHLELINSP